MGKNNTKQEKSKRNAEYALRFKKKKKKARVRVAPAPSVSSDHPIGGRFASPAGRIAYPAICSACSTPTTIPFEPTNGKPVYCRPCFDAVPRA